ncbi:hypothetical protein MMC26_006874 [Xylographa opegraphella]|nr:hypothetical protein [Xylographa opegraphella]
MLPKDLLVFLNDQIPCRQAQIRQLASLLDPTISSPSVLAVHGLEATGKSLTVKAILDSLHVPFAIVLSKECITARHLLERTIIACKNALEKIDDGETATQLSSFNGPCESFSSLAVQLERILRLQSKFILVFDGVDQQREAPSTLLPALARLGEIIPKLTVIFIVTAPRPRFLHLAGVPHLHFTPYDRKECLVILSQSPLAIFASASSDDALSEELILERQEDDAWLWSRFCGAVWDSLGKGAARDIVSLRNVCQRLWVPFVQPIRDGLSGTREFSKLLVRNRSLFQTESALNERILSLASTVTTTKKAIKKSRELPYFTTYLLVAAYLASYNPARQDQTFFMKAHERKRRKKGGGTAKGRPSKHRKIQRKQLGPQAFVMERMVAIFHAITPHPVPGGTGDLMSQIATLASSKMLVKTSTMADILDAGTKWRVNVGWDYIQVITRTIGFEIEAFLAE